MEEVQHFGFPGFSEFRVELRGFKTCSVGFEAIVLGSAGFNTLGSELSDRVAC